jgi:hypothetical protein
MEAPSFRSSFTLFRVLTDMGFMPFSRTWMDRSHRAKRLAVVALGVGVFALAARTLQPSRSTAAPNVRQALEPGSRPGAIVPIGRKLGELMGQEFRILVHASELGPRYTVISPAGIVLAEDLSETEVGQAFPGLEIETMTADAPDDMHPSESDW